MGKNREKQELEKYKLTSHWVAYFLHELEIMLKDPANKSIVKNTGHKDKST